MTDSIAGKVVIVTGAAGGVGKSVVTLLASRGANIVAEDLSPQVFWVRSGSMMLR